MSAPSEAGGAGRPAAAGPCDTCDTCAGLTVVYYDRAAEARPSPFCGACGRELELALVEVVGRPARDFNHARVASRLEDELGGGCAR